MQRNLKKIVVHLYMGRFVVVIYPISSPQHRICQLGQIYTKKCPILALSRGISCIGNGKIWHCLLSLPNFVKLMQEILPLVSDTLIDKLHNLDDFATLNPQSRNIHPRHKLL